MCVGSVAPDTKVGPDLLVIFYRKPNCTGITQDGKDRTCVVGEKLKPKRGRGTGDSDSHRRRVGG